MVDAARDRILEHVEYITYGEVTSDQWDTASSRIWASVYDVVQDGIAPADRITRDVLSFIDPGARLGRSRI